MRAVSVPFISFGPTAATPIVISVPHAGQAYPEDTAAALAVPLEAAQTLEDRLVDLLAEEAARAGHAVVVAQVPRLLIDLNRAETDFLADSFADGRIIASRPTHRARAGLGLIPQRLPDGRDLWRTPPRRTELAERLATVHRPYHAAIAAALSAAREAHGFAVLIDLHSMPSLTPPFAADVVIGTLHGRSAAQNLVTVADAVLQDGRVRVARDRPYAGAHILERHGQPSRAVHALQIEIDRRLYLDRDMREAGPGLAAMRRLIAALADALAQTPATLRLAAE